MTYKFLTPVSQLGQVSPRLSQKMHNQLQQNNTTLMQIGNKDFNENNAVSYKDNCSTGNQRARKTECGQLTRPVSFQNVDLFISPKQCKQKKQNKLRQFDNVAFLSMHNKNTIMEQQLQEQANSVQINDISFQNFNQNFVSFPQIEPAQSEEILPCFYISSLKEQKVIPNQSGQQQPVAREWGSSYQSNFDNLNEDVLGNQSSFRTSKEGQELKANNQQKNASKSIRKSNTQTTSQFQIRARNITKPQGKRMEGEGILKVKKNKYKDIIFKISETTLDIQDVPIEINKISKVKIFPNGFEMSKHYMIKINMKGLCEEIIIGVRRSNRWGDYPLAYYTFSKVIIKRLKSYNINSVTSWELPEKKAKKFYVKSQSLAKRIAQKQKSKAGVDQNKSLKKSPEIGTKMQQQKQQSFVIYQAKTFIHGRIYKKSRYLSNWQNRYVIINQLGIYSYRNENEESSSISIDAKSITQIWTSFHIMVESKILKKNKNSSKEEIEQYQYKFIEYCLEKDIMSMVEKHAELKKQKGYKNTHEKYIIIKVKHGFDNTEFAIPICNYDSDSDSKNWLYAFFKVLPNLNKKQ